MITSTKTSSKPSRKVFFGGWTHRRRLALAVLLLSPISVAGAVGAGDDHDSHSPPVSGPYAYYPTHGLFGPDQPGFLEVGESYVDPVFGGSIRRMSARFPAIGPSLLYVKNGFWNSDGSRFLTDDSDTTYVIDTASGAVVYQNVPGGFDKQFDPVDPDLLYYFAGDKLRQLDVTTGADDIVKSFGVTLRDLGGSVDWIDASGRYMVLPIGNDTYRIYDRQQDLLYDGSIERNLGPGWIGISPDAEYLIAAGPAFGDWYSYEIDHATATLETEGVLFWTLCGDHGDILSASDGKTYVVTFECYSEPAVYAVDVTIPQTGDTEQGREKQRTDNRKLIDIAWEETGHISGVATGAMQDWVVLSLYDGVDTDFHSDIDDWRPFRDEILRANVLTGELDRLAHHRSRVPLLYCRSPRASASWDGSKIMYASNYGFDGGGVGGCGYSDLYLLEPAGQSGIPCSDVVSLRARCRTTGPENQIQARVLMTDGSHDGETLEVTLDGAPRDLVIAGNRASLRSSGAAAGSHTVELTDPAACVPAVVVSCP